METEMREKKTNYRTALNTYCYFKLCVNVIFVCNCTRILVVTIFITTISCMRGTWPLVEYRRLRNVCNCKAPCVSHVLCFTQVATSNKQQFFVFDDSFEASYQSIIEEIVCKNRNGARDTHAITTIANIPQSSVHLLFKVWHL